MIRDAEPADAGAIGAIWNPIIRDTVVTFWPTERGEAEIAALIADRRTRSGFFVACGPDGGVLGYATYHPFRAGPGYARCMEHSIATAPEARGLGLGARLMAHLEAHAAARGAHTMIGAVSAANTGSRRFHARLGYGEWGLLPQVGWKFGRFHDLVLMGKLLAEDTAATAGADGGAEL